MSYEEKELQILRKAVDQSQEKIGKRAIQSPEIQEIIGILENFLRTKHLICYGGIAINNILPKDDQFYNREVELPDYDFFSASAMDDAIELADIYYSKGYKDVEAKAGQHVGTYKVFVNFMGVADITYIPRELFSTLTKQSIIVEGISYVPANYLRMGIYKELSSPEGDTSRFEKIYKRLLLLNKYYPITQSNCSKVEYQRKMDTNVEKKEIIYNTLLNAFIDNGVVFFGGYALSVYSEYMPKTIRSNFTQQNPDFDVISTQPQMVIDRLKHEFKKNHMKLSIIKHEAFGELIPKNYEIKVNKETVAFIYTTGKCLSYNEITVKSRLVKIATIDTMLFMYFSFLYADKPYYDTDRIICMCDFLYKVQQENKLAQKGVLKRFSITCYGHEEQLEEMRAHKAELFQKLRSKQGTSEYNKYFLQYRPSGNISTRKQTRSNKIKTKQNNYNRSRIFSKNMNTTKINSVINTAKKTRKNKYVNPYKKRHPR